MTMEIKMETVVKRFRDYISFNTQSDEANDKECPSTPGQMVLAKHLADELRSIGLTEVTVDEHGECKGSGRSVQGFNLHDCIGSCADLLIRYGGHAMAAGLSVREENLPALRRRLNEWAARMRAAISC